MSAGLLAVSLTGCTSAGGEGSGPSTLTIGSSIDITSFDTASLQGSQQAVYWDAVYDTVVQRRADGSLTGDIAEKWAYNTDHTVLTLTIRPKMTFSDGSPVDAEAVAANMDRNRKSYGGPRTVSAVSYSGSTVVLKLSSPNPALLTLLANTDGAVANPKAFDRKDLAYRPAGSGAYTRDQGKTIRGSQYTFVKRPGYWNAKAYPYQTVVIKPLLTVTARLNALRSGQIDATSLDATTVDQAKAAGFVTASHQLNLDGLLILDRAGEKVKALGDVRVRQAINMAFDREAMVKNLLHGHGEPTDQIFIKGNQAHLDGPPRYSYDLTRARQLMAEAGYADGFAITMPSIPISGIQDYDAVIQQGLKQVGIRVTYQAVPAATAVQRLLAGDYPMFFYRLESQTAWYDLYTSVLPAANFNGLHAQTPELTGLMNAAAHATTDEAADPYYHNIAGYLRDQAWFAPLLWNDLITATDKKVHVVERVGFPDPFIQDYTQAR